MLIPDLGRARRLINTSGLSRARNDAKGPATLITREGRRTGDCTAKLLRQRPRPPRWRAGAVAAGAHRVP